MKLINPSIEFIPQEDGLDGIYKQIELAGRVAYKSEDKITDTSAKTFVDRLISSGHTSVLEHGTVYLYDRRKISDTDKSPLAKYISIPHCEYKEYPVADDEVIYYVTTNYRVIVEYDLFDDLEYLKEDSLHYKRYTFRIICDRAISHQIVRHRSLSFTQESQRFCNYTKGKFGNNVTFVIPRDFCGLQEGEYVEDSGYYKSIDYPNCMYNMFSNEGLFINSCFISEGMYMNNIEKKLKPQLARKALINATKTELIVTGTKKEWQHFVNLRTANGSDPDIKYIAQLINHKLII